MANQSRGQTRRRTRPTIDAAEHDELELDDHGDDVTPIEEGRSRAERRRRDRRTTRARRKKIVIEDEEPQTMWVELLGVEYEIIVPDVGTMLDLADQASGSPKDQLIEWIDEAFNPEDADDVIDRLDSGEVKWGRVTAMIRAVSAAAAENPTG